MSASDNLQKLSDQEKKDFENYYKWLEEEMPKEFLSKCQDQISSIIHSLMNLKQQEGLGQIQSNKEWISISLEGQNHELDILKQHSESLSSEYHTFLSKTPFLNSKEKLRVSFLSFEGGNSPVLESESLKKLKEEALPSDEYKYEQKEHTLLIAWKGFFDSSFLYQIAKIGQEHGIEIQKSHSSYIDHILLLSLTLNKQELPPEFLEDLSCLKFREGMPLIETTFIDSGLLKTNQGALLKAMGNFIHQSLVHLDLYAYSLEEIEKGLCYYPTIACKLLSLFHLKFHPQNKDSLSYEKNKTSLFEEIHKIETGLEESDIRRKNILTVGLLFIDFCLKTNFYEKKKPALCFRLDPLYLDKMPYETKTKFPALPFGIYFMKGFHFIGFHIRFKDLARGGLRTVIPKNLESAAADKNNLFSECYNLGYTQQKKNKDIPEGGSKGVIFLDPFKENPIEHLYEAQRAYIESFLSLINCTPDGKLKAANVIDYLQKPEYIYLGPDENMHTSMINWIAAYSKASGYKPGIAFISSKPQLGFNHKELGVTSLTVNVYMEEVLRFMGIDPTKETFTVKMTGGPDGDVAGNQMLNLLHFYPKTAKLLTTIDISGTIFDPEGLNLKTLEKLFLSEKPIAEYPTQELSLGGFLLDNRNTNGEGAIYYENKSGKIEKKTLTTDEASHLLRHTVHSTQADIFIPAGGRPKTLKEENIQDFLTQEGKPTAKGIIEGANLYLTQDARRILEKLGTLIVKDSSANKGGVICSSFEILSNLCLQDEEFMREKEVLTKEILEVIKDRSRDEGRLLLQTSKETGLFLTDISEKISEKINSYTYEILSYLEKRPLSETLNQVLLDYCLPTLRSKFPQRVLEEVPDIHKKAIISCHIAAHIVYHKGLSHQETISSLLEDLSWIQLKS